MFGLYKNTAPIRAPFLIYLAAAAVVVAAAVVTAVVAAPAVAAAVAQQENQDDDPADVAAAETVIVTHKNYLRKILQRHLPLIPRYSESKNWCEKAGSFEPAFVAVWIIPTDRRGIFPLRSVPAGQR